MSRVRISDHHAHMLAKRKTSSDARVKPAITIYYHGVTVFFFCLFAEAQAEIAGASEKYLMLNSPLHLECVVRQSPVDPVYIFWYHDSRMINYDIDRGVNVTSDLPNKHSALYIERASRAHSGNYTCAPSNAFPANTVIHILNGKCPPTRTLSHVLKLFEFNGELGFWSSVQL